MTDTPWVALRDVCGAYGFSAVGSARNAVLAGRFPVETYKVGKLIVIDREVHRVYFANKRRVGLKLLETGE